MMSRLIFFKPNVTLSNKQNDSNLVNIMTIAARAQTRAHENIRKTIVRNSIWLSEQNISSNLQLTLNSVSLFSLHFRVLILFICSVLQLVNWL